MHAFDRRTDRRTDRRSDGRTEFSSLDRVCLPCSAVKTTLKNLNKLTKLMFVHYIPSSMICFFKHRLIVTYILYLAPYFSYRAVSLLTVVASI